MCLRAHNASSIYIIHKNILREKLRNHIVITYHNPQNLITWHPHIWLEWKIMHHEVALLHIITCTPDMCELMHILNTSMLQSYAGNKNTDD